MLVAHGIGKQRYANITPRWKRDPAVYMQFRNSDSRETSMSCRGILRRLVGSNKDYVDANGSFVEKINCEFILRGVDRGLESL
jgi:hypothetical protein